MVIEKLVFGGQGLAHQDGKPYFVWNALPGEEVEIEVTRNKKEYAEGVAKKILQASGHRIAPVEAHFLSCSPWQIMPFEEENHWKRAMAVETYNHIGGLHLTDIDMASDAARQYGYRNKMEFSFAQNEAGEITLALFERGKKIRTSIPSCALAEPVINETALKILAWINQQGITLRSLKTVIVRSDHQGKAIAALFIKDRLTFDEYPELDAAFVGFQIFYSTHKSPASVPTALLYSNGATSLTTIINGVQLSFGLLSFFQINVPMFIQALAEMQRWLDPAYPVIDYYSGVGAISLALASSVRGGVLIDNNAEAIQYAQGNIMQNNLGQFSAQAVPAEHMTELITAEANIIMDPPRAGLHSKVVQQLLAVKPPKIIYVSCNVSTQARDIAALSSVYRCAVVKLYNFFPRTPHVEGLCVLERRV